MTAPRRAGTALRARVARRPARTAALLIGLAMVIMITRGHRASSGDAAHYLVIAHSIVTDGDLDVANNYGAPLLPDVAPGAHVRIGRGGATRPAHDIGLPLIAAPVFAAASSLADASRHLPAAIQRRAKLSPSLVLRQLISLAMIALTAGFAALVVGALQRGGLPAVSAAGTAILWALSPPVLSHGFLFMTEIPTAVLAGVLFLARERAASLGRWRLPLLGAATGGLLLLHARNVGLAAGLAAVYLWRLRADRDRVVLYALGLAIGAGAKLLVSLWFWGGLVSPHEQVGAWNGSFLALVAEVATRAIGLLTDARHGLLWSAPIYLLLPAAWWQLRKRSPDVARDLAIVAAAYLVFVLLPVTNVHGWRGGWSPAARFLTPLAGLAVLATPGLLGVRPRWVVGGLIAVQIAITLTFWLEPAIFWSEGPGPAAHLRRLLGTGAANIPPVTGLTWPVLLWAGGWLAAAVGLLLTLRPRATESAATEAS